MVPDRSAWDLRPPSFAQRLEFDPIPNQQPSRAVPQPLLLESSRFPPHSPLGLTNRHNLESAVPTESRRTRPVAHRRSSALNVRGRLLLCQSAVFAGLSDGVANSAGLVDFRVSILRSERHPPWAPVQGIPMERHRVFSWRELRGRWSKDFVRPPAVWAFPRQRWVSDVANRNPEPG